MPHTCNALSTLSPSVLPGPLLGLPLVYLCPRLPRLLFLWLPCLSSLVTISLLCLSEQLTATGHCDYSDDRDMFPALVELTVNC